MPLALFGSSRSLLVTVIRRSHSLYTSAAFAATRTGKSTVSRPSDLPSTAVHFHGGTLPPLSFSLLLALPSLPLSLSFILFSKTFSVNLSINVLITHPSTPIRSLRESFSLNHPWHLLTDSIQRSWRRLCCPLNHYRDPAAATEKPEEDDDEAV